jgi:ankyrin repeat protein
VNVKANDGSTALILAASSGDTEIARELLSRGADASAKLTQTGKTALMLAKEKGYTDIVQLLEAHGAKQEGATST